MRFVSPYNFAIWSVQGQVNDFGRLIDRKTNETQSNLDANCIMITVLTPKIFLVQDSEKQRQGRVEIRLFASAIL